jgi:hypothetical protein
VSQVPPPFTGPLPRFRGTQIGLDRADSIDQIKADMLAGRFAYAELRARITGLRDPRGVYHIKVGHHRMAAALEIYKETGDERYVRNLLRWGRFDDATSPPIDSRPMPSRDWWGAFRNWIGW